MLWEALAVCMSQRLGLLHERLLHLEYSCPMPAPDVQEPPLRDRASQPLPSAGTAAAAAEEALDRQRQRGRDVPDRQAAITAARLLREEAEANALAGIDPEAEEDQQLRAEARVLRDARVRLEAQIVADGLVGLCILNEMTGPGCPGNQASSDTIGGLGQAITKCHSLLLAYAETSNRVSFLKILLSAAARQLTDCAQHAQPEVQPGSGKPHAHASAAAGVSQNQPSFSAAARQLLEGPHFWETPDLRLCWPQGLASQLVSVVKEVAQSLLPEPPSEYDNVSSPSDKDQSESPSEPKAQTGRAASDSKPKPLGSVQLLERLACGASMVDESAVKLQRPRELYAETLFAARAANLAAARQRRGALLPASDRDWAGSIWRLKEAEHLFRLMASTPLEWLRQQAGSPWALMSIALAFESLLLQASQGTVLENGNEARLAALTSLSPGLQRALGAAGAAVHSFLARLAASENRVVGIELAHIGKTCGMDWPFQAAAAMQGPLTGAEQRTISHRDDPPSDSDQSSLLEASAAIMHHLSRHTFTFAAHPLRRGTADTKAAVNALCTWLSSMQAQGPGSPEGTQGSSRAGSQLLQGLQLEAVCTGLRSALASISAAQDRKRARASSGGCSPHPGSSSCIYRTYVYCVCYAEPRHCQSNIFCSHHGVLGILMKISAAHSAKDP